MIFHTSIAAERPDVAARAIAEIWRGGVGVRPHHARILSVIPPVD